MRRLAIVILLSLLYVTTYAECTVIIAGKKATADGSVINSHTDCGPDSRIRVVQRAKYPEGAMAPIYYGIQRSDLPLDQHGDILGYTPQVQETYKYFHSAYSHINEFQLAIGESTLSQRDILQLSVGEGEQIMSVEQATVFALQRCKTAKEAVTLITSLMEEHGFLPSSGPNSECLTVADPNEVWVLEFFSVGKGWKKDSGELGVIWAAKRLPDDHIAMIPNWSIIRDINIKDKENCKASKNYMQFAIDKGWYNPKSGNKFNWQKAYSPIPREWATSRFWLFHTTFVPNMKSWPERAQNNPFDNLNQYVQYVEDLDIYPFSVKPEEKLTVQDVMKFQRSTYSGTIYDKENDPAWYYPGKDGKMIRSKLANPFPNTEMRKLLNITYRRNVSRPQGHYGMIAQLRSWLPNEVGGLYWVFLDNAYVSSYVPIYAGITDTSKPYQTYDPTMYSPESARWAIDFVENLLYLNWQDGYKMILEKREPLEQSFFSECPKIEAEFIKLNSSDPKAATQYITEYSVDAMDRSHKMFTELRNILITKHSNTFYR